MCCKVTIVIYRGFRFFNVLGVKEAAGSSMSLDLVHIIFGMKVRQARLEAELARQSELSPSYLTEMKAHDRLPR